MTDTSTYMALQALGLTEAEAKLYLSLVQSGPNNVSAIARSISKTRVSTYPLLQSLVSKKCIAKTQQHARILYQALDPKNLLSRLEKVYEEGSLALSSLSIQQHENFFIPEIKMYSGAQEIAKIYDDVGTLLPKGGTYFRYTSRVKDTIRSPLYSRLRVEKEIERLVITSEKKLKTKKQDPNRFIKTVPKNFAFDDNATMLIYGTKIAHMDFNSDVAIVIDSPHLARFQEKIFKLLWGRL